MAMWNNDAKTSCGQETVLWHFGTEKTSERVCYQSENTSHVITGAQALMSNDSRNDPKAEEPLIINAVYGPASPPGTLRDTEEELDRMRSLLESNIETLRLLIVKVYQYSNKPIQDASCPTKKNRSLKELESDFRLKMDILKQAVEALSSTGPPNHFSEEELYYLILHIKNDDWIHLMRVLHINESEMEACRRLCTNLKEQKYQMLKIWLSKAEDGMRTHREHLVQALELIDYERLASMFNTRSHRSAPLLR